MSTIRREKRALEARIGSRVRFTCARTEWLPIRVLPDGWARPIGCGETVLEALRDAGEFLTRQGRLDREESRGDYAREQEADR